MDGSIVPSAAAAAAAAKLARSVPILVRTNVGTNISFTVSEEDTVRDLKRRIATEHVKIHPDVGDIKILHVKLKWGKSLFSLSDSMSVRDAFHWKKGAWILSVDASCAAAARDMVATSADNQMGANGGEHTSSFKVACKQLNDDALGNRVSGQCNNQGGDKSNICGEKMRRRKRKNSGNVEEANVNSLELEKGTFCGMNDIGKDLEGNKLHNGLDNNQIDANIKFAEGVNELHDKQSNGLLLERVLDGFPVDKQNCNSILLDKFAPSSTATTKKLQQNKKRNEKFQGISCLVNQDTEESLEAACLIKGLDGNANTNVPEEVNRSYDKKYDVLQLSPLMDKTPIRDPAEVESDDCSELPRASIEKSAFMKIFSPQELERPLTVEKNPRASKSGSKNLPKASRASSRTSNAQKEDDSADTLVNHGQAKHKKKSRLDKLSDYKENSDGSTCQENLQEEDTKKRSGTNAGMFTADGKLGTKPTPSTNARRQVKSLLSKGDTLFDMDSPIDSGENTALKSKEKYPINKAKNSKFGAATYSGRTLVGATTSLKIAAPSLSSASTEDNSPTSTSHFRVAVRHNIHGASGKSTAGEPGEDGVFSARDTFSDDLHNETSENEHGADNRAANFRSELNYESQQDTQFSNVQVIDYRDSSSMKNVDMENRDSKNSTGSRQCLDHHHPWVIYLTRAVNWPKGGQFKLGAVLRNTKAYKKASTIITSQSQVLEVDRECPNLVPESEF